MRMRMFCYYGNVRLKFHVFHVFKIESGGLCQCKTKQSSAWANGKHLFNNDNVVKLLIRKLEK